MTAGSGNIDAFIARWQGREGGQERANYALFLSELCDALGVTQPEPASANAEQNDYVFKRVVKTADLDGNAYVERAEKGFETADERR
jgi:hypothetical protein